MEIPDSKQSGILLETEMKLALSGISGSGKDYLAKHLIKNHQFTRVSFSDQLKKLAKLIYPWMEQDYPEFEKELPLNVVTSRGEKITLTPRQIWLKLNCLRDIEDGLFIRMLEEEMALKNSDNIVISDIRTKHEFNWCVKNGFTTVYINPTKYIYERNSFDNQIMEFQELTDFEFVNNFDGLEGFEKFIQLIKDNSNEPKT